MATWDETTPVAPWKSPAMVPALSAPTEPTEPKATFWCVWSATTGYKGRYPSAEAAYTSANDYAMSLPGIDHYVLEPIALVKAAKPVVTTIKL